MISVYSNGKRVQRQWSPIIPKSTLFVISNMSSDETNWEVMLLVNPTSKIPLILIVDVVFLMVLGVIIIIVHLREKVSQSTPRFTFTAIDRRRIRERLRK